MTGDSWGSLNSVVVLSYVFIITPTMWRRYKTLETCTMNVVTRRQS